MHKDPCEECSRCGHGRLVIYIPKTKRTNCVIRRMGEHAKSKNRSLSYKILKACEVYLTYPD